MKKLLTIIAEVELEDDITEEIEGYILGGIRSSVEAHFCDDEGLRDCVIKKAEFTERTMRKRTQ